MERYRKHIAFAEVNGRKNVICWRNMASYIVTVSNEWYNRKKDEDNDSERIVVTAAKLIRSAIREMECDTENYPASDVFASVDGAMPGMDS